ncbi:hypothetical protein GUJ93_ZPchr0001g29787 [Zizania palustris]|uniref:Uncharacterized protein n=1 Tax=Zizania palustris TaxID=103762 RepID=A0A8J5RX02_ZIZPA|nr:hypothetical protein GUJ93_ZPchr0001g29787 [Zizania palustris]
MLQTSPSFGRASFSMQPDWHSVAFNWSMQPADRYSPLSGAPSASVAKVKATATTATATGSATTKAG